MNEILTLKQIGVVAGVFCLLPMAVFSQDAYDRLTYHAAPKPLSKDAVTENWPRFLGATDNSVSRETKLSRQLDGGLKLVWEVAKGQGYTAPSARSRSNNAR